jgi:hypothetical protein
MSSALFSARTASPAFGPAPCKRGEELFGPRLIVLWRVGRRGSLTSAIRLAGPIESAGFAKTCAIELNGRLAALVFPE